MSKKEITPEIELPRRISVSLKSSFLLLEHLSNKESFLSFIAKFYADWTEEDIVISYIWFLGTIIDEICDLIIALDPFFLYNFDKEIDRGNLLPLHYTSLCTNSIKGRLIYFIYKYVSEKIFKINNFEDLFLCLEDFSEKIKLFKEFFINLNIPISKKFLNFMIENLINPVDAPIIVCRDISFIQSRFFKNHYEYLNFFKNERGNWISSKGFFVGISYSIFLILGETTFHNNKELIAQHNIPFKNFSQEENGLYNLYSLYKPEGDYELHEYIQLFASEKGVQPLFKLIDKKVYRYFESVSNLFELLPNDKEFEKEGNLSIDQPKFKNLDKFLRSFPIIKEKIGIDKIFYYQNIYTPVIDNTIREHSFFKSISTGLLDLQKNVKQKVEMIVFHIIDKNEEKEHLGTDLIKPIDIDNPLHFLHNISKPKYEKNETLSFNGPKKMIEYLTSRSGKQSLQIGYFFQTPAFGHYSDYSYWIGSFYFGANDLVKFTNVENENFLEFSKFCKDNVHFLDVRAYLINSNYLNHLYNLIVEKKVMNFKFPSPFALFFSSAKDIESKIVLDNYKESYNRFVKSFESQDCSNKEKKEALEYLTFCIFDLLPEFKVIGMDVMTEAEEIDLIITIDVPLFDIFDILGSIFIIECRNLKEKVDAKQIRDFGAKVLGKKLRGGIIISREGITGRTQLEGARLAIRDLANQGVTIIVMDKKDLKEISMGKYPINIIKRSYTNSYFKGLK